MSQPSIWRKGPSLAFAIPPSVNCEQVTQILSNVLHSPQEDFHPMHESIDPIEAHTKLSCINQINPLKHASLDYNR